MGPKPIGIRVARSDGATELRIEEVGRSEELSWRSFWAPKVHNDGAMEQFNLAQIRRLAFGVEWSLESLMP